LPYPQLILCIKEYLSSRWGTSSGLKACKVTSLAPTLRSFVCYPILLIRVSGKHTEEMYIKSASFAQSDLRISPWNNSIGGVIILLSSEDKF